MVGGHYAATTFLLAQVFKPLVTQHARGLLNTFLPLRSYCGSVEALDEKWHVVPRAPIRSKGFIGKRRIATQLEIAVCNRPRTA